MKIDITYPSTENKKFQRRKFIKAIRWPFIAAAVLCPVINLAVGGKAWSLVVLMSLYAAWKLVLSPDLVEYNRISQVVKFTVCSSLILILVDVCLAPGWAITVVPIVCFAGLSVAGILFLTDFQRQKQNLLPMLMFIVFSMAGAGVSLVFWHGKTRWTLMTLLAIAALLLLICIFTLGSDFIRELKRRFNVK